MTAVQKKMYAQILRAWVFAYTCRCAHVFIHAYIFICVGKKNRIPIKSEK